MLKNVKNIDRRTMDIFRAYSWPGNVRELQHAIEHAMNILPDDQSILTSQYFPKHISASFDQNAQVKQVPERQRTTRIPQTTSLPSPKPQVKQATAPLRLDESLNDRIHEMERDSICQALRQTNGNVTKAALILKMPRQNLHYRIKRYQIDIQALLEEP